MINEPIQTCQDCKKEPAELFYGSTLFCIVCYALNTGADWNDIFEFLYINGPDPDIVNELEMDSFIKHIKDKLLSNDALRIYYKTKGLI